MINKIIDGISEALHTEFGHAYKIYTESIGQGLEEQCFSILCLNSTIERFLGERYFRQSQFVIQYFPSTNDKNTQSNVAREKLFNCLEIITVDGELVRGTKMKGEIIDGVLNFFLNYDLFVYKKNNEDINMGSYEVNTDLKG